MVNSSWTQNHILQLWKIPSRTFRVYPPCEVSHLKRLKHIDTDKIEILSIGQFRPEKGHQLQVHAMDELRELLADNETLWNKVFELLYFFFVSFLLADPLNDVLIQF